MMEREAFTFYSSFLKTGKKIKDPMERLAYYEAIMEYGITHETPDMDDTPVADACFEASRPNLDSGWDKAIAGKKGGEKQTEKCLPEKDKQNEECLSPKKKQTEKCLSKRKKQTEKCLPEKDKLQDQDQDYNQDQDCNHDSNQDQEQGQVITTICAEPETDSAPEPPVITLTLNDRTEYPVYQSNVEEWGALYPAVDVIQELRKMRGWIDSNPKNRKTRAGVKRFITGWLARTQDHARPTARSGTGLSDFAAAMTRLEAENDTY